MILTGVVLALTAVSVPIRALGVLIDTRTQESVVAASVAACTCLALCLVSGPLRRDIRLAWRGFRVRARRHHLANLVHGERVVLEAMLAQIHRNDVDGLYQSLLVWRRHNPLAPIPDIVLHEGCAPRMVDDIQRLQRLCELPMVVPQQIRAFHALSRLTPALAANDLRVLAIEISENRLVSSDIEAIAADICFGHPASIAKLRHFCAHRREQNARNATTSLIRSIRSLDEGLERLRTALRPAAPQPPAGPPIHADPGARSALLVAEFAASTRVH